MPTTSDLVLALKQHNKSHVGYGLQEESEDLLRHVLQNMVKSRLPSFRTEKKNKEDSIRYREEGNQRFVSGEDTEAIESYTLSLAFADSKELMAYAHANRSAALYRKQFYKECLMDIDAAISLGYPEEKQKKLKERGDKAVEEIKKSLNLDKETQSLLSANDTASTDSDGKGKCPFQNDEQTSTNKKFPLIKNLEADVSLKEPPVVGNDTQDVTTNSSSDSSFTRETVGCSVSSVPTKPRYLVQEGPPMVVNGPSKEAPSASDGVRIAFSDKFGRHLVASKAFRPGDILAAEDPYASVIYRERYYTHCHHCLMRCYNMIPCPNCPMALYCSEKCKKLAWDLVHEIECPITALLSSLLNVDKDKITMVSKITRLLLIVTKGGTEIQELKENMKVAELNPDSRTAGFTDEGIFDSRSARSALSLATNMTNRPLIGISAFACISALAAMLLATQTKFFKRKYELAELRDVSELEDISFCGAVMLRACVIMSSNCFSVQHEPGIKAGSGLYVLHSLHNHSCCPNTFRHFEGLTMITRALVPIHVGDQIFTSYGADHAYMPRPVRKMKMFDDYFFKCECPACKNDWPTYREILQNHVGSISKNKPLVEKLKPFNQRLLKNKYDIDAVKQVLEILDGEATKPCEEVLHAMQFLKSYYFDP